MTTFYALYYLTLEPVAALLYLPQLALSMLAANAFAERADANNIAGIVHVFSWVAQFVGHGAAEGRAPALKDNILGGTSLFAYSCLSTRAAHSDILHSRCPRAVLCSSRTPLLAGIQPKTPQGDPKQRGCRSHSLQERSRAEEAFQGSLNIPWFSIISCI